MCRAAPVPTMSAAPAAVAAVVSSATPGAHNDKTPLSSGTRQIVRLGKRLPHREERPPKLRLVDFLRCVPNLHVRGNFGTPKIKPSNALPDTIRYFNENLPSWTAACTTAATSPGPGRSIF